MIAGSSLFFFLNSYESMLCLCHYGPALLRFWFQTDIGRKNSASFLKYRRERPFLTMLTGWSRSTSSFYALIGQNLTDEFMRKVYAASWNLFTLTAEAYRVWCQLVTFSTVFFHWMYKMQYVQLPSRVFCYSWLVCLLGFWSRNASLVKAENPISDGIVFFFTLLDT